MASIKSLQNKHVHSIQAGQVIVDLTSLVQELAENSLDAGATHIDVRFKDYGLKGIEVQDNGAGIEKENYSSVALKNYTSKTSSAYSNDSSDGTFGSRGDALSAICALAQLELVTAQDHEVPRGTRLNFDNQGRLVDTSVTPCEKGTVAKVSDLFNSLPVRRKEFEKNARREYAKALALLQAYACINTRLRFAVSNLIGKGITAFKTILNSTVRENIANIFGARKVQNLLHFDVKLEKDAVNLFQEGDTPQLNAASIQGLMSKASAEANHASDRQLFYVNSRPCHLPQVSKSFNEIYKLFNLNFSPFVFANLLLSPDRYEVRLLPGKTTIHLHDEQELLETLKSSLSQLLKAQPFSFPQNTKSSQLPSLKQNQSREGYDSSILSDNKRHNDDYHEINTNSRKTKNAPKEATPSVSGDDSGSDEADCRSDGITDDPALPSSCIEKEQELERYPEKRAFRPQMHSTHTGSIHQSTEKDLDYRNFKRPRLEISSRGGSTSPIELAKVSCTAKNTIMWSDNAIDTNHSQEGSPGPDTAPAAPNRFSAKGNHAAVRATLSGINLQQDKVGNLERREQYQNEPRAIDDGSGFTSARNHRDITLLQNNKQEDQRESIESHHLVINDDKSRQRTPPVDEDRELEQIETGTVNGEEGIVDEREYQAYQKSKVSSLIARAEEARVISSKNLKIRAVSALSAIHRSGGMMKPVRSLKFTASSSRIKNLYFKGLIKYDDKVMNNDMKDLEDKVDSLSLSKSEFASMRVIGQFNYGFVLAVKAQQKAEAFASPDLFIIDQHASDEKYNFENYENTLSIKSQRLAQPQRIELTAVEEELISRHNDVLIKNGFKLSLEDNYQAGGVSQQRLVGLPSLGGVLYNKSDFQDLLNILSESNEERVDHKFFLPRPAKTRKILAMKACRSSIMIGKSLSKSQMKQIILQMGRIEKPWHCPHGRPTIKYLSSLSKFKQWREGDGVVGIASGSGRAGCTDWTAYLR